MIPECVLIVGPSGCGKTFALLNNILIDEKIGAYNYIFILCPTISVNDTYLDWAGRSDDCIFEVEIDPAKLDLVISFIINTYAKDKVAIIVDDMSSEMEQHRNRGKLNYLAYSGRHHDISTFILSQKLSSIATGIRDNTTRIIFFPTHCKRSIKTLRDEFFGQLSPEQEKDILKRLREPGANYLDLDLSNKTHKIITKHH